MLKASQLTSEQMTNEFGTIREEWLQQRIGKITSSQVWKLCQPKGWGDTGWGYIRTRAFERLSKVSADKEVQTPSSISGLVEEGSALRIYMRRHEIPTGLFRVQILVNGLEPWTSTTPDAVVIKSIVEKAEGNEYNARTVEVKNFEPLKIMKCLEAETALDVKEIDGNSFWQKLDQEVVTGCLSGDLVYYNSQLGEKKGGYKEIEFRQVELRKEIAFLKQRKAEAEIEIQKIVKKLTTPNT